MHGVLFLRVQLMPVAAYILSIDSIESAAAAIRP